ncbi:MAG: hypothetical protein J0H88_16415 [Sphingomonadales bacterium]|nr:hypothetical protein [Sphingomonadales bacterium]
MGDFLTKLMVFWPLAVFAMPVLLAVGLLWLRTKFPELAAFNKAVNDIGELKSKVGIFEVELKELRNDIESEPTRAQLNAQLSDAIARLSRVEGGIEGVGRQIHTQSQWIQALALPQGGR